MVLEGCAEPHLACCILLRGAPLQELVRVKKVVKFMLLACYNWKLEKAFLGDIEAVLPEAGRTFDDDSVDDNDVFDKSDDGSSAKKTEAQDSNERNCFNNESDNSEAKDVFGEIPDAAAKPGVGNDGKAKTTDSEPKTNERTPKTCDSQSKASVSKTEENQISDTKCQELDDPLQKAKFMRKTDSDKTLSCGVPIRDFSDPLRATLSVDDDVFLPKEEAKLKADETHGDRWSTDDTVLSMSPNVIIPAPYLETEAGRKCPLRVYFPKPLLSVPSKAPHTPRTQHRRISRPHQTNVTLKEVHPFIANPITTSADDIAFKAALSHYRATGCRLVNNNHAQGCPLYKPSVVKKVLKQPELESSDKQADQKEPLDPLAPESHQRLSLLLYSYSNKSPNVPDFCVNPWIATMEMYGRHDISLGAFLEKYCFSEHKCTSPNCNVPMNQHIRRFVHGDVCITITCNTVGHSNMDKMKEEQSKQVMFWSRCEQCGSVGRAARMSPRALALSLAQYVRLRMAAPRYVRRRLCAHPLHAHAHAFVCRLTTACFRYSKVATFEIELPPEVIHTRYDTKQMRDALINQLNELMLKGHETFSGVADGEAEKEYQVFKQQMEHLHLALTSSHLQEHTSLAGVVRSLWSVSDRIIAGEKMLRDANDMWTSPPAKPNKPLPDTIVEEKSDVEDSGDAGTDSDNTSKELEKEHGAEEDEEKADKKTVRQILSQLLSNNQTANQSGMIISSGLVPVVVMAGEIGSVIAATLASVTYQRTLASHKNTHSDLEDTENLNTKEKTDADKSKARNNDHIEVLLKDGLVCRVYYASQFHKLRHTLLAPLSSNPYIVDEFASQTSEASAHDSRCSCEDGKEKNENKSLCDIEEGFIRSLAYCVPWAAKGGKSGSTFCKTKDDRYVLKEMTKPEWQQFLEFAPHYFSYVTSCHQNKLPSLLARILGVYSVGGAGNGVLVMENVWYSCSQKAKRFDLKGSSRHRLTNDTQPLAVLMDENLLNLRWETQLYVASHTGSVLWACVERDTSFLASHDVMDYSLLLGIDQHTLTLGIIDYIRTFTWDKKLEHLVKKNLGSGQPTVVSPLEYKRRFFAAARKYFLQCPAHWDHLYNTIHA
ncbi:putative 1-phosphatidylinositol 3-phosphate 5-kinase [Hyposmocoma kahamanoa]|uniref:putative 1-phosphatidylinositol 3-phosphate 5-kinase n=1 Tax=Hyposmocoma kahamanoa TaxID=1477025 RepID=UPI000E6D6112|nr:putative 1-phosphatidylinositol 3-phosphate 5-kinase [Hyposmocoma kahamanoa]